MNIITNKEAMIDLANRLVKQKVETLWTIERIKPLDKKQFEKFQGAGANKEKILASLEKELKEREENIKVINKMILEYEKRN